MCDRSRRHARAVALIVAILAVAGCGKRGSPQPPRPRGPLPAHSVTSRQLGGATQVGFTVPDTRGAHPRQQIAAAELIRVTYPPGVDPPADPDSFRRRGDVVAVTPPEPLSPGERILLEDLTLGDLEDAALGWTLRYAVRVRDGKGRSSMLALAGDLVPMEPAPSPRDLLGEPTAEGVRLNWSAPESERDLTYNVYRTGLGELWPDEPLNNEPLSVTEYLDGDVEVGRLYAYTVRVVLAPGKPFREGAQSRPDEVVAEDRFAPAVPEGLVSVQEGRAVRLFWDPNGERDLAGYRVYRVIDGEEWQLVGPELVEQNSFLDGDVTTGQRLAYKVSAVDRADPANESEHSESVELEILEEPVNPGGTSP